MFCQCCGEIGYRFLTARYRCLGGATWQIRPDPNPDPIVDLSVDWRSTTVDRWSGGDPAMVNCGASLLTVVDRWSGGGSDDSTRYYAGARGSDKEASRMADVAHCGWWIGRMIAANDEVRGIGSRANDWRKD
ncbi:hypothetical protein Tco_0730281 [Tanacetum coccineum]|uniref:Uncharacterized protein n=1 Tax=Tanacetum coccineum TaxID=301880 RepID=A0ABQ4YRR6_9ASTR